MLTVVTIIRLYALPVCACAALVGLLQLCGQRRVLLVPPSEALPGLAPFPVAHPYDGYSMPALCYSLVYDTPGVDLQRAAGLIPSNWPHFASGKVGRQGRTDSGMMELD